jgi:hypothetical protein
MSDTQGQTTSTQGQTTSTQGQTTSTQGQTTSTQGQTNNIEQSYRSQTIENIKNLINDVKNMFPNITPSQLTELLNSGVDIGKLLNQNNQNNQTNSCQYDSCQKSQTVLNSRGIEIQNRKGPSTNIVQIKFNGTSNIYSPYLYYNKATTEKFISTKN